MKTFIDLAVAGKIDCTIEEMCMWKGATGVPLCNTQESLNQVLLARIKAIPESERNLFQKDVVSSMEEMVNVQPRNVAGSIFEEMIDRNRHAPKPYPMAGELQDAALRYNTGKPQWHLVDMKALEPMIRVLEYGAKKYSTDNWRKGMPREMVLDCLIRHVAALLDGEENDPESGLPHIGHVMCNAMFYVALERDK
jgi:hypothetical protein